MESPSAFIFELRDVKVSYGFRVAVHGLTLQLTPGKSLGLLGVNGAGKTSTIRALLGMLRPRAGSVALFGAKPGDPKSFRRLGFAPEDGLPPDYLTGEEYLSFIGAFRESDRLRRADKVKELLDWFELSPKKKIRDYSKGMKKRLVLAQAFYSDPELLILDEPLNGLDPLVIIKLRDRLEKYRKGGGSVLYSSHILAEVEKTCTDIAILSEGKLAYHAPIETLLKEYASVEDAFSKAVIR